MVPMYKHLGVRAAFPGGPGDGQEVAARVDATKAANHVLAPVLRNKKLPKQVRMNVWQAVAGARLWLSAGSLDGLAKLHWKRIATAVGQPFRQIAGRNKPPAEGEKRWTNMEVRAALRQPPLEVTFAATIPPLRPSCVGRASLSQGAGPRQCRRGLEEEAAAVVLFAQAHAAQAPR